MAAGLVDLRIEQGATWRRQLLWLRPVDEQDPDAPRVPYDLTDATAHMQIRSKVGQPVIIELIDGDGIELGGSEGTIDLHISSERTMLLRVRKAVYDLYVNFPSGDSLRVLQGAVAVTATVTDPVLL